MGIYDTYGKTAGVQLKVGDPSLTHFNEGDEVDIADGVYLGYEGAVVIIDGKLEKVFTYVRDKWGGKIKVSDIINPINPITQAIESLKMPEPVVKQKWVNDAPYGVLPKVTTPTRYVRGKKLTDTEIKNVGHSNQRPTGSSARNCKKTKKG